MTDVTASFEEYGIYYDLLNRNKSYDAEADYVLELVDEEPSRKLRILELGCGTGAHAARLAELGHSVLGVDLSSTMLSRAEERRRSQPSEVAERLDFVQGDIREFRSEERFDLVVSLFHVFSYQIENQDLERSFLTAHEHLRPGGTLVFDYWHGSGVLRDLPGPRSIEMQDERYLVSRNATAEMHPTKNRVDVRFDIQVSEKASGSRKSFQELHRMRYLFLPEVEMFASFGFSRPQHFAWRTHREPGFEDWLAVTKMVRNS